MGSVAELRELFEKRLAEGSPEEFHPQDLERINDDKYLSRVLAGSKEDMVRASKLLGSIFKWRKVVGAAHINEETIRMDYVQQGVLFPHGRDLDGCKLLIVKCKDYDKNAMNLEEVKKIFIYWLDRIEREENGNKITLFLDLDGASLSNFDIELIKYMIELFHYYPKFLNQIVIYQLPWILTAAFKIVKGLLPPEAVAIMKFATKDTVLKGFVSPEQALSCWGGKDDYEFTFVPEKKIQKQEKRVSFATTADRQNSTISTISTEDSTISTENSTISTMFTAEPTVTNSDNEIIFIQPNDKIEFRNESEEIVGRIKITNLENKAVAFKIRTTGPEKFWVRPSSGILQSKKTEQVSITILPGYQNTAKRERFLVMATPINNPGGKDLGEIWKNAVNVEEFRLTCQIIQDTPKTRDNFVNNVDYTRKHDLTATVINDLKNDVKSLKNDVSRLRFYQILSFGLGLVSVFLCYLIYNDLRDGRIKFD